jgi:hypothetical protein
MSDRTVEAFGRYLGRLILEPLPDGRLMRLVEPFGFLDDEEKRWPVPVGTKVDGASIPQPLWSVMGGPFEGRYRDASVIHDYYCDVRSEPSRAVHRVFYNAMRASGVSALRAKLMFAAVYFAGPRWSDTVVDNTRLRLETVVDDTRLRLEDDAGVLFRLEHAMFQRGVFEAVEVEGESTTVFLDRGDGGEVIWPSRRETRLHLDRMEHLIEADQPSLTEIEAAIDNAAEALEGRWGTGEHTRVIVPPAT